MNTKQDLEVGDVELSKPLLPSDQDNLTVKEPGDVQQRTHDAGGRAGRSPLNRLIAYGRTGYALAQAKAEEMYPHVLDRSKRFLKLCGLTFMIIFVVMLASWWIALSHWFTIVLGHIILHYTVPEGLDPAFDDAKLDNTMIMAAVGAFVVNLPPFIIFLFSFPLTFDRTVLEGSTAPANEFIKRITPQNRYTLIFMKYAPRLVAAPIGSKIFWVLSGETTEGLRPDALDPLHAFLVGLVGELVLTGMGHLKDVLKKRATREENTGETLPI
ncbi:hypothetical protein C8Q80DRAFT_1120555 [Daedaleopsis nitida]|nr:hypothetical protein C8Q80DRAFT_1120555 [Daedaleopsis nitida]